VSNQFEAHKVFTQNDRRVSLADTLTDRAGNAIDLTGFTVKLRMVAREPDDSYGDVKIDDQAATIVDAATGSVRYDWLAGDVDTAGDFYYWWLVIDGSKTEHYPVGARALVTFEPDPNPS